jgi:uncharacterized protein YecE (DUF72 family)
VTEQLNLFGDSTPAVRPAQGSPLSSASVAQWLQRWPNLYLGTSSWTFPGWQGLVYQEAYGQKDLAADGLAAYAQTALFRTVSLDRTYYRPMTESGYNALREQVPSDFRFVVKAPRDLLRIGPNGIDSRTFDSHFLRPTLAGLRETLGVVLLQFPPGTASEVGPGFLGSLGRFLEELPKDCCYSLEIRDEALLGSELRQTLQGTGVSLCPSIHSALPNPDQQLLKVPPNPGTPLVFRWNLRPSLSYREARDRFQPFQELTMEDPIRRRLLADLISRALKAGRQVFLTANNKAEGCAPLTLLKVLEELSS